MAKTAYLFVFLEVFEQEGGIQSYVQDILSGYIGLANQPPADVFLLRDRPNCHNPLQSETLRFHYLKTTPPTLGRLRLAVALLIHLLRHKPQRVICGHINLAPLVQMLCQPLGIPYTIVTYGKEVWFPLAPRSRKALQQATQIWAISRYSRDQACASNQLDPEKIKMLPCAIDGDRFTPGAKSVELVEQYGLAGARVLMTVARLWSGDIYKGVDVTIRALPAIAHAFPDVKYLVIGRGDDQPRLAQLAQELAVADRVIFAGFVPTEHLPEHYRLADVYVMPSQEGFGIVYLEAMASGVPALSGDADGSAEPMQDGKVGWRVPHRDPVAVANACIEILKEQEVYRKFPDAGAGDRRCDSVWLRQEAIEKFGKAAFLQRLQQVFEPMQPG